MALVDFSEFYPEIRTEVPQVPLMTVNRELRRAVIRLCEKGKCLKRALDPVVTEAGIYEYDLAPPQGMEVHEIDGIELNGKPLDPLSLKLANARHPGWRRQSGTPIGYYLADTNLIHIIYPPQHSDLEMNVDVFLKPTRSATRIESYLVDNFFETILSGALANILSHKGRDYHDQPRADRFAAQFASGVMDAERYANNDGTGKKRVVVYGGI